MRVFAPLLSAALSAILLAGCAHAPEQTGSAAVTTYVIVRHAEKGNDDPRDPSLTAAGLARAHRIADSLQGAPLAAVYATTYRRTQQTAAPSAQAHRLTVTTYDARRPAVEFAAQLRESHRTGTVLVVGHSNTAPAIAAALCRCEVAPMAEDEFDRRMTVRIDAAGNAVYDGARQP